MTQLKRLLIIIDNTINKNPWILFLLLSIQCILSYGVDLWLHLVYNLKAIQLLKMDEVLISGIYAFKSNPMNIMYYYGLWITPWLEYGLFTIFISLIVIN